MRVMICFCSAVLLSALSGCAPTRTEDSTALATTQPVAATESLVPGRACTVYFRRDFLGALAPAPIAPLSGNYNNPTQDISGTLLRADEEWVVVRGSRGEEYWVPRQSVLAVKLEPQQ